MKHSQKLAVVCIGMAAVSAIVIFAVLRPAAAQSASINPVPTVASLDTVLSAVSSKEGIAVDNTPVSAAGLLSSTQAAAAALELSRPGSAVMATRLAVVSSSSMGGTGACWIVEIDPKGGIYSNDVSHTRANYDLVLVDARTGFTYGELFGFSPALPPLPAP